MSKTRDDASTLIVAAMQLIAVWRGQRRGEIHGAIAQLERAVHAFADEPVADHPELPFARGPRPGPGSQAEG